MEGVLSLFIFFGGGGWGDGEEPRESCESDGSVGG